MVLWNRYDLPAGCVGNVCSLSFIREPDVNSCIKVLISSLENRESFLDCTGTPRNDQEAFLKPRT